MKVLNFFLFLWVIFALLDPDRDSESGSGSTNLTDPISERLIPFLRTAESESAVNCYELLEKLYLYSVHIWCEQLCTAGEAVPVSAVNSC